MDVYTGRLSAGLSAILLLAACRTPAGSRLADTTGSSTATATATTTSLDCDQVAASIHLSSTTAKAFCSSSDPAGKTACMVAASEALTKVAGASVTPGGALSSISVAQLCASDSATQMAACIRASRLAGLGSIDTSSLCASGSPDVAACLTSASEALAADASGGKAASGPLGYFDMTGLCKGGGAALAGCISAARKAGMSSATTYTSCKKSGGGGSSSECLAAASTPLTKPPGATVTPSGPLGSLTVSSLCSGSAGNGVAACITTARTAGFSDGNTYTLCKSGNANGALCITSGMRDLSEEASGGFVPTSPLGTLSILSVCSSGKDASGPCIETARLAGLSSATVAHICSKATEATVGCIKAARPASTQALSDNYTLTLCTAASGSTEACITDARAAGKSDMGILGACRPPGG